MFASTLRGTRYGFADLKQGAGPRPVPPVSGDQLAGLAAESAAQRVAARHVLADCPLRLFLEDLVAPYESDEISRLIIDSHDAARLRRRLAHDGGPVPRLAVCPTRPGGEALSGLQPGLTAGDGRRGQQADCATRT